MQNQGVDIAAALRKNKALGLPVSESSKNQYINLHILATEERDNDVEFQPYRYFKGLRGNENFRSGLDQMG